jgi:hypothetical protein
MTSVVSKFGASLTDDARVIIYDHHMFRLLIFYLTLVLYMCVILFLCKYGHASLLC